MAETPQMPDTTGMTMVRAPPGAAAVGGRVSVHFAGVGFWCRGEVLAYDATLEVRHSTLIRAQRVKNAGIEELIDTWLWPH